MRKLILGGVIAGAVAIAWSPPDAYAEVYGFTRITSNGSQDVASQMEVEVLDAGSGQVSFTFTNSGPLASSITDVYFDDGSLLGIAEIINGTGVNFSQGASPGDLPGGNAADPDFEATAGFTADSNSPTAVNGVNPGETLTIVFDLLTGKTFADTIAAIEAALAGDYTDDVLRIGIHVQAQPDGQSDSFINGGCINCGGIITGGPPTDVVPEPASLLLLGTGLGFVANRVRRRSKAARVAQA